VIRRVASAFIVTLSLFACTRVLDIGEDVTDGPCGEGDACRPGVMCTRTCESCFCNDKSIWYCSPTCAAEDAGSECPAAAPTEGSACTTAGASCTYKNPCGALDAALCVGSKWQYYYANCPPPVGCPPMPPMPGSPCSGATKCQYKNRCGVNFYAECDGTGWQVPRPPPCPDPGCPTSPPEPRSTCTGEMKCEWPNPCGTRDFGYCAGGYWTVNLTCTPTSCPLNAPPNGAACAQEGLTCTFKSGCEPGMYRSGACEAGAWRIGSCG